MVVEFTGLTITDCGIPVYTKRVADIILGGNVQLASITYLPV